ncbi:MAG: hypothetical protein IKC48_02860 [Clostridia bacterium]|nr:hypothetical protein [Clostridia bacterium]
MPTEIVIAYSVFGGFLLMLVSLKLMQILQLSSYRIKGLVAWLKNTKRDFLVRYFALAFFSFVSMFVYVMCFGSVEWCFNWGFLFFILLCAYFVYAVSKQKSKTPLRVTKRIFRLFIVNIIVNAALCFAAIWFTKDIEAVRYSIVGVTPLLCPITLILSHILLLPVEKLIAHSFIKKATRRLAVNKPTVIGITGSYGKTTAKKVLATFLHTKYKVFASPHSYNTPMGLSKCINEEYGGEEIFVAEMGARYVGDIKYLTKIFHPKYAMLTAIGNQHLETFKTKENIIKEKTSILDGVTFAVANGDSIDVAQNVGDRAVLCGKENSASYSEVKSDINGTDFVLTINGESVDIHTRLVGDHIPSIVTLCARLAFEMGVSLKKIKEAAANLPFVEHRLEVMKSGDVIIFDDSYNSNPVGADNALKILSTFEGTKVVITPGFVELGEASAEAQKELGEKIASIADHVFLLGPNAQLIKSGMGDFQSVVIVDSLDEAMEQLKEIPAPMAVLFENDLPDNY